MTTIIYEGIEYRVFNKQFAVSEQGLVLKNFAPASLKYRAGYLHAGQYRVHRMVAFCWLPEMTDKNHVHHVNRNRSDNRAENLRVTTIQEHCAEYHYNETLEAMWQVNRGRIKSLAERHKLSLALRGKPKPESLKEKLRELRTGAKLTDTTKQKIKMSVTAHFKNPENLIKYRESLKSRRTNRDNSASVAAREIPCEIDGVLYDSVKKVALQLGLKPGTIRKRLLSKNFTNYIALKVVTDNGGYKPKRG